MDDKDNKDDKDEGSTKKVTIANHDVPWDDFLAQVSSALEIDHVDYVRDAQTSEQVTCVTYLSEGDVLQVKKLTENTKDTQEKSLLSVRTMLASTQSALWDFFMDKSRKHERDGSFDRLTNQTFAERAKWIPLRLTLKERKVLRLVKAALSSSSYTSRVDKTFKTKTRRLHTQVHEICAFLSGIVTSLNYEVGQDMVENRQFSKRKDFFQTVFEITRRHKIMNPEKMRTTYTKLMYLLQDARTSKIKSLLEFDVYCPLTTVYSVLESSDATTMLNDPLMSVATMNCPDDKSKTRWELDQRIRTKRKAIKALCRKYSNSKLGNDSIEQMLYAIGDNSTFLDFHRDPIDKMISMLTAFFSPDEVRDGFSLSIVSGGGGGGEEGKEDEAEETARLTHSHGRQFHYVRRVEEEESDFFFFFFSILYPFP